MSRENSVIHASPIKISIKSEVGRRRFQPCCTPTQALPQVCIIGAGVSGLRATGPLTEACDRISGRVCRDKAQLGGDRTVDTSAC